MNDDRRAAAALFLVSAGAFCWEVLLTRIYSAVFHYHFAFMAVSIAMFGLTAGAVAARKARKILRGRLGTLALAAGLSMPAAIAVQLALPARFHLPDIDLWYLLLTYALSALPFVPAGAFTTLALTEFSPVGALYACDLAGAGAACLLLPAALALFGGPGSAAAAGALCCAGAALLNRRPAAWTCALALAAFAAANAQGQWLRVRWSRAGLTPRPLYESWNVYSRVMVSPVEETEAFGWSVAPEFRGRAPRAEQLMLTIDSGAATPITRWAGDLKSLEHLKLDLTSFAHRLRRGGEVLVIGAGGGRDALTALAFGQKRVTAVEVNSGVLTALNGRFGDFSGHLDRDPRLRFVNDEGRSFAARTDERYDLIQASLVDTAAAAAAGAYALVENGLYTVEAWSLFLDRLKPGGLLTVSRAWSEMPRAAALAGAALRGRGAADPSRHVLILSLASVPPPAGVGTIVVARDPLSAEDLSRARAACAELHCVVALGPEGGDEGLRALLDGLAPEDAAALPFDASPPTDDRPFFFFTAKPLDLLRGGGAPAARVILSLAGWSLLLALALTLPAPRGGARLPLYFTAIGLSFLFVEVGLIQRLSLFLGHPTLGFTTALCALLVFGGLGSYASPRLKESWTLAALPVVVLATDAASAFAQRDWMGASTPVRVALAVLLCAPAASLMGCALPFGMTLARRLRDERRAWLWAVNGAASTLASVLAMACSLGFGIGATLRLGALGYVAAALLYRSLR